MQEILRIRSVFRASGGDPHRNLLHF